MKWERSAPALNGGLQGREPSTMPTAMNTSEEHVMSLPEPAPVGWLTTEEVAELAGCSPETVIRAIHHRKIENVVRKTGGMWLINRDEGIAWAANYQPYEGLKRRD